MVPLLQNTFFIPQLVIFNAAATLLYITAFITCSASVKQTSWLVWEYNRRAAASVSVKSRPPAVHTWHCCVNERLPCKQLPAVQNPSWTMGKRGERDESETHSALLVTSSWIGLAAGHKTVTSPYLSFPRPVPAGVAGAPWSKGIHLIETEKSRCEILSRPTRDNALVPF